MLFLQKFCFFRLFCSEKSVIDGIKMLKKDSDSVS